MHGNTYGQTNKVGQFWNEFAFTESMAKGWSTEFDAKQIWSSDNYSQSLFADHNQWHLGEIIFFIGNHIAHQLFCLIKIKCSIAT